jgi:hypothetical protein
LAGHGLRAGAALFVSVSPVHARHQRASCDNAIALPRQPPRGQVAVVINVADQQQALRGRRHACGSMALLILPRSRGISTGFVS